MPRRRDTARFILTVISQASKKKKKTRGRNPRRGRDESGEFANLMYRQIRAEIVKIVRGV